MKCWNDYMVNAVVTVKPCMIHGKHTDGEVSAVDWFFFVEWTRPHDGPFQALRYYDAPEGHPLVP